MTLLALTPTPQPRTASALNLTALLAAGTLTPDTGVQFVNGNNEVLYVQQTSTPSTIVVQIGTEVEGEPVTSITLAGVASAIQMVGPFDSVIDAQPGDIVTVTFGTPSDVTSVALVSNSGAY